MRIISSILTTMRGLGMSLSVLPLVLLLFTETAFASIININITVDLDESRIYDCGGSSSNSAYPVGTMCWSNIWDPSSSITPQTVNLSEDTIIIQMNFADSRRMRWETDGIISDSIFGDESVQVGLSGGSGGCCSSITYDNSLSFLGVTGDLISNPLEWSSASVDSGGIVSQSYQSGLTNLTDSVFEFDGLVSTIGPFTVASSQAYTIDRAIIFLTSGNFSYVSASTVPTPQAVWLFGSGLLGLIGVARKKTV
jgi:hypothetical protein